MCASWYTALPALKEAEQNELLIVSVSPQNLERDVLWFAENSAAIKKARLANPWWRENALFLEKDLVLKPSFLARRLTEMGYERGQSARGRGLFAVRGGIIEVWPVNDGKPSLIEFSGNVITEIAESRASDLLPQTKFRPPHRTELGLGLEKLPPGSYAVHIDHGIGVFKGILADDASENSGFFVLEYAPAAPGREPDRLLVPKDQKDRIAPYVGFSTPTVHRLGGNVWISTKRKAREDAEKLARSLLALYAARHAVTRPPYAADQSFIRELRESFGYTVTEGQTSAEEEIMRDFGRDRPMDRILAGDVGFGKTEIAIRAAAAAVSAGVQVAVLVPTTVLAIQHERTFRERLAKLPIAIRSLSRLTPPKDEKQTLKELAEGKTDCIIGTHRLLSQDVAFKNLGLVVIDEEQRFGVKQKERFKELRAHVDILSLSATPIPRTLSLALAKLRDISRIDTPPEGRVPIVTSVLPYGKKIIRDAIRHELGRQGQVYFLHNRIETLGAVEQKLKRIIRSAHHSYDRTNGALNRTRRHLPVIRTVHGRMKEKDLIRTMDAFRSKKIDILVATTLIENGIDISSANTLIADDASRLGLAEAHQLRGRIGRGSAQACAYFLYPPHRLTEKAAARLGALKEYAALGAGYDIALRDLEIRGAGNILGRKQAGAANKVGLNLYCQMLAEAVENATGGK